MVRVYMGGIIVNTKLVWMFVLFMLVLPSVTALGIAPSREVIDYTTNTRELPVTIINSNHEEMRVAIYAQGEYADYVTIDDESIYIAAEELEKTVKYSVKLPNDMKPGATEIDIVVLQLPTTFLESDQNTIITDEQAIVFKNKNDKNMIGATTAIIHRLIVNVPYPGKYLEGSFFINSGDVDEPVTFTIGAFNRGTEDVTAQARVRILGPTNEEIASLDSEPLAMNSKEEKKFTLQWTAITNPGVYSAEAIINYDDKQVKITKTFTIGRNQVNIKDIDVQDFQLGQIAKMDISVENEWNQQAENVYALVKVMDSSGSLLSEFSTSAISINPQSLAVLNGYWETQGLSVGTYTLNVVLHYSGKQAERFFETVVGIDSVNIKDFSKIGGRVVEGGAESSKYSLLVIIVIILVIINIGWFVYLRKRKQP